jgi:predicted DNA-binding transcriptional regulator AlpA
VLLRGLHSRWQKDPDPIVEIELADPRQQARVLCGESTANSSIRCAEFSTAVRRASVTAPKEAAMQGRKSSSKQSDGRQLSLFDISASPPPDAPCIAPGASTPNHSLSIDQGKSQISRRSPATATIRPAHARRVLLSSAVETDQWWTTDQVCAFLKLGRKAIWERRRNPLLEFPKPANLGGGRNHYRASAIRDWAERMALASLLAD